MTRDQGRVHTNLELVPTLILGAQSQKDRGLL